MASVQAFRPHWASPPGDTIRDVMLERGLDPRDLPSRVGLTSEVADGLIHGSVPITLEIARKLADSIGASVEFWMSRDAQYRDDLAHVEAEDWMSALPLREMYAHGWITEQKTWDERLAECLRFFGVGDVPTWRTTYASLLAESWFRRSGKRSPEVIAAWLRRGELLLADAAIKPWNPAGFRESLSGIRSLTRSKDPAQFFPQLQETCSWNGVAVGLVRPPSGIAVSGASRFLSPETGLVMLSGRFLTDDHLWFTFFHEAGHLLLHDESRTYIDDLSPGPQTDAVLDLDEIEANQFAQDQLVPASELERVASGRLTVRAIVSAARQLDVSPGILAGQLQHAGLLPFQRLNGVKRRYRWRGSSLEMA